MLCHTNIIEVSLKKTNETGYLCNIWNRFTVLMEKVHFSHFVQQLNILKNYTDFDNAMSKLTLKCPRCYIVYTAILKLEQLHLCQYDI